MQQMIWRWKAWTNAKLFGMYYFSEFFTVFSRFWKWQKTYFRCIFYKLYWNGASNIPLKSYGKCKTFSCWRLSLIPSRFKVISDTARSFVLPLSRNKFFESAPRGEPELPWHFCLNSTLFFDVTFFARNYQTTYRNWANDIPMESCWKHATFSCWSFFHTRDDSKYFFECVKMCF